MQVFLDEQTAFEEFVPPFADFAVAPALAFGYIDMQYYIIVLRASCPSPYGSAFGCAKLIRSVL